MHLLLTRPHLGQLVTAALRALLTMGIPNPGPARLNSARLSPMGPDSWERLAERPWPAPQPRWRGGEEGLRLEAGSTSADISARKFPRPLRGEVLPDSESLERQGPASWL